MSQEYFTLLTSIGRQKLHNAILTGSPLQLTEMAVGDGAGAAVIPNETMTSLSGEVYRAPITHKSTDEANPNWAILNLVIPVEIGGWYVREAGIYDADGDLIFIGSLPENYKALPAQGIASDLAVNMVVDIQRADSVTIVVDPATVLASQEWVGEVLKTSMRLHDEDPTAHEALVDKLTRSGRMVGREEVENEVYRAMADATAAGTVIGRDELHGEVGRAIEGMAEAGRIRTRLADDLTVYVRADGDDRADGLSKATAMAGFPAVFDRLRQFDPAAFTVTVDIGEGDFPLEVIPEMGGYTYTTLLLKGKGAVTRLLGPCAGNGPFTLEAVALVDQLSVNRQDAILRSVCIQGTGSSGGIQAYGGANVHLSGDITVRGELSCMLLANRNGYITCGNGTVVDCEGAFFSDGCVQAIRSGSVDLYNARFTGQASGRKYLCKEGGSISWMRSLDLDDLPGDLPGLVDPSGGNLVSGTRMPLHHDLTVYVREDGDDAADGLTAERPLRTIARALQQLNTYDPRGKRVTIDVGAGTFPAGLAHIPGYSRHNLRIRGAGREQTSLRPSQTVYLGVDVAELAIEGAIMVATSCAFSNIRVRGVDGSGGIQIQHSVCSFTQDIEFEGDMPYGLLVNRAGHASCGDPTNFQCVGTPSFSQAFFVAMRHGFANFHTATFSGDCVGRKFSLAFGGSYSVSAASQLDALPGNLPGFKNTSVSRSAHEGMALAGGRISATGAVSGSFGCVESAQVLSTGKVQVNFNRGIESMRPVCVARSGTEGWQVAALPLADNKTVQFITTRDGVPANTDLYFVIH